MKAFFAAVLLCTTSTLALAGQQNYPPPSGNNQKAQIQGHIQGQLQSQTQTQSTTVNAISAGESAAKIEAQPAYAPGLASLVGTGCMGSVTASGGGGGIVSLGFGSSYVDHDCERRANAQYLSGLGYPVAALALLCQNDGVADALAAAGQACPRAPRVAETAGPQQMAETDRNHPYSEAAFAPRPLFGK